jgi:hypothetical protein
MGMGQFIGVRDRSTGTEAGNGVAMTESGVAMAQERDSQEGPPARRFDEDKRRQAALGEAARGLGPEAAPFLALATKRFRLMQQAADTTAEDLTNALEALTSEMSSHDDEEIRRLRSIGEALIKQARALGGRGPFRGRRADRQADGLRRSAGERDREAAGRVRRRRPAKGGRAGPTRLRTLVSGRTPPVGR